MLTDDQGNTGADGPLTAFSQVAITVTKPSRGRRR
jgi:hypothetical protein